jgi:hypothetical protein
MLLITTLRFFLPAVGPVKSRRATLLIAGLLPGVALAQTPLTWQQIKDKFEAVNPILKAAQLNIDESRAAEITAYLRPNPTFTLTADGFQVARDSNIWRPFSGVVETPAFSYLHERERKRELRRDQAKESTAIWYRSLWTRSAVWCLTCGAPS